MTVQTNKTTTDLLARPLTDLWEYEVNNFGGGNQERQMYVDEPEFGRIEDGELIITAKRKVTNICGHTMPFTSGRVRTKRRFDFRFGIVSFEAKLPEERGLWPAVWMLPTDQAWGPWPRSGEIDILEARNDEGQIHHAIHFGDSWESREMEHAAVSNPDPQGWVRFQLEWEFNRITWSVNGTETFRVQRGGPFRERFHLIVNLAVGGLFPGREPFSNWQQSEFRVRKLEVTS